MPIASSILVVDDEPNLRTTLSMIFQRAGHAVTVASNLQEARQSLHAGDYDLVFLDLKMPDGDGLSLLPEIRRDYPEVPVLFLTAYASLESAIEAVRQGARDYLLKPVDPEQILTRVEEVLSERQPPRRRREIVGEIKDLLAQLESQQAVEEIQAGMRAPAPADPSRYLTCGKLTIDLHARHVTQGAQFIPLSPTAFDYLVALARHSPQPVTPEALVAEAQGFRPTLTEALDLARWRIHELRKALEPDPRQPVHIITVRGLGYRLVA